MSRVLLLLKSIRRTVRRAIHPRRVQSVRMDGRVVDAAVLNNVNAVSYTHLDVYKRQRIRCACESCYPEVSDETCCCAWRFTLAEGTP